MQPGSEMQLGSVASETHAARSRTGGGPLQLPDKKQFPAQLRPRLLPALQRILPAPAPAVCPVAPPYAVRDRPPPGLPAPRLPGQGRSEPGA